MLGISFVLSMALCFQEDKDLDALLRQFNRGYSSPDPKARAQAEREVAELALGAARVESADVLDDVPRRAGGGLVLLPQLRIVGGDEIGTLRRRAIATRA